MMRADLVRDHDRPSSNPSGACRHGPGSASSSGWLAPPASPSVVRTTPACRRWSARSLRTGRFAAASGGVPTSVCSGVAWVERYAEMAAEFVRLKVDVIVTVGGAVAAAKQATATIPIVFAAAGDPVGSGMVASLAQPGGNVTGLSVQSTDLAGKRLEILREALPNLRRLSVQNTAIIFCAA